MRNTILLFGLWISLLALGASCSRSNGIAGAKSVVVFHSWGDAGEEGEPFRLAMEKAFQKKGVKVRLRHIYLNTSHQDSAMLDGEFILPYLDSLQTWKPEVLLVNDDAALDWAFQTQHREIFSRTPVVFSGINALNTEKLARFKHFTGFEDRIDLNENLRIIHELTGEHSVIIELDPTPYDQRLYGVLQPQLEDSTRIIDNRDFHLAEISSEAIEKLYPGMSCISFFEMKNPWHNMEVSDSVRQVVSRLFKHTKFMTHLNIKEDLWNNTLIDYTQQPQFTAVREGFNDAQKPRYIAGFFTSMQTQVDDQVDYAVQILKGAKPEELAVTAHKKGFYLDYQTVEGNSRVSLNQVNIPFEFVNLPFQKRHPFFYSMLWFFGLALAIALTAQFTFFYLRRRNKISMQYIHSLESEASLRAQYLYETNSSVWRGVDGVIEVPLEFAEKNNVPKMFPAEQLMANVHPDSKEDYIDLMNYASGLGEKKKRIRLSFDKGETWHWYDIIYNVTAHAIQTRLLSGLFINVDEDVEHQEQLKKALEQSKEIALKERFLENVTQDLEAPMHQVDSHCRKLAGSQELTAQETHEINTQIRNEVNTLLDIIDSVVQTTKQV